MAALRRLDTVPRDGEAAERVLLDRLDLAAEARERSPAQRAEHAGVAPIAAHRTRPEHALDDRARVAQAPKGLRHGGGDQAEAPGHIGRRERSVRARVAPHQRREGIRLALEEGVRQPERQRDAQRVAVASGVFGGDETPVAADFHLDRAALRHQSADPVVRRRGVGAANDHLVAREVAEPEQQLVEAIRVTRRALACQMLQRELEVGHGVLIEQLAELDLAQ